MPTYFHEYLKQPLDDFASRYLRHISEKFDESAKEMRVLRAGELDQLDAEVARALQEYQATTTPGHLASIDKAVDDFIAHATTPVTDRARCLEREGEILHWVSCQPGEVVLLHSNERVTEFYAFDLWLHENHHARWLREKYADGVFEVERRNQEYVDTILLVTKRYGPQGPALLHEWLRDRFRDKRISTINIRSGAIENPEGLAGKQICLLYDLVRTGSAVHEVHEILAGYGAGLSGVVLLYQYPDAQALPFTTHQILSTTLEALPDEEGLHWFAREAAKRRTKHPQPRLDEWLRLRPDDWRLVQHADPVLEQLAIDAERTS